VKEGKEIIRKFLIIL